MNAQFCRRHRFFQSLIMLLCLPWFACAAASVDLKTSLDTMISDADDHINIGVKVVDVANSKTVYEKNAGRTYTPASNQKVVTAAAGLLYLGPEYRFKTQVLRAPGEIENHQLNGNVVIKFAGDPELRISNLSRLIKELAEKEGIKRIQGDVIIDESAYGGQDFGPGWMWDDMRHCFSAPISANILNQNCAGIRVAPGKKVGAPVTILPTATSGYVSIVNHATTKSAEARNCYIKLKIASENKYILEGCLSLNSKPRGLSVSLDDPDKFNKNVIRHLFKEQKITVTGKIKDGRAKGDLKLVAEHRSEPLTKFIHEMLKESDNLISDTLFKKLGSTYFKGQGTWKSGSKAVRRILASKVEVHPFVGVIADGSGLSRYNLISPEQMVELLEHIYQKNDVAKQFITALPISGIDGTLEHRMGAPGFRGKVKAKTGTMANVTSLSGFVYTKNNKTLAFSIIINGVAGSTRQYKALEDQICELLIENY